MSAITLKMHLVDDAVTGMMIGNSIVNRIECTLT